MLKVIRILVQDRITEADAVSRAMVDFNKIAHIQEDSNGNSILIDDFGAIAFVSDVPFDVICGYLIDSREVSIQWHQG